MTSASPGAGRFSALADRAARNPYFRFLMNLGLPLGVSLALHAALTVWLVFQSFHLLRPSPAPSEFAVGISEMTLDAVAGGFEWDGGKTLSLNELRMEPPPKNWRFSDLARLREATLAQPETVQPGGEAGGFGLGGMGRSGVLGVGSGAGEGGGAGLGSGFGAGGASFAGIWSLRARGSRFVYVIDFSGSITVVVDSLKREIKRSIGRLQPDQSFDLFLFFSVPGANDDRPMIESFSSELTPATSDAKAGLFRWIESRAPRGKTEPVQAMREALSRGPEVIFLLSDGYFEDAYVDEITALNASTRAQIYCLVFDELLLEDTGADPRPTSGARRLDRIARQNRGVSKIVTAADLR